MGTRGIPNRYGGFEQVAQYLSEGLVKAGHSVTVYCSNTHPCRNREWNGVTLVHCHDAEPWLGTAGQFVYDLNCILDARKKNFEVWLFLGYTSSSVWRMLFPKKTVIISNMDGLEWKRAKYALPVRAFLKYAEKIAVKYSDYLIADAVAIQAFLENKYEKAVSYISYGAEILEGENEAHLAPYTLNVQGYFMVMCRMEPENNIEMILEGFTKSSSDKKLMVIGNMHSSFGRKMLHKYSTDLRIHFAGNIFDAAVLHSLKYFCSMYFHGHSAGGTNPSLLEAMASRALIAAHDNEFNRPVLGRDALYFNNWEEVRNCTRYNNESEAEKMKRNNFTKITTNHNWPYIIDRYERFISDCHHQKHT